MKQGNPNRKRFGIIALIGAMLAGFKAAPDEMTKGELHQRKAFLLTNGGMAPIPGRLPNQRQRRKRMAQTR